MSTQVDPVNTLVDTNSKATITSHVAKINKPDFGSGKFSAAMEELYGDALNYVEGIEPNHAERLARAFGADLGRTPFQSSIGIGKVNKDGKINLRDAATAKGVTMTNSIAIAKAISLLNETLVYGVKFAGTKIVLKDNLWSWLTAAKSE